MSHKTYDEIYNESLTHNDTFWKTQGEKLHWTKPFTKVSDWSFEGDVHIRWFADGMLNAAGNCLDRHIPAFGDKPAILWEGNNPTDTRTLTYFELYEEVCKFSNVLKSLGVKKGDRVAIYMPMVPEAAVAMLACARVGAVHSVVFGGFSPKSLEDRINDCGAKVIITANEGLRGTKSIPLKANVDEALQNCPTITHAIVLKRTDSQVNWVEGRDVWYHETMKEAMPEYAPEQMNAEDPLFILYTSGSTGKPKGVLHTTAGYLAYTAYTFETIFDIQTKDIYWCTADVGWITGHSYVVYGPLLNGATILMYEGIPTYPSAARMWEVIDRHNVTLFYTAPTAIRALMKEGDQWLESTARQSLRLLGTVGEPINVEAWKWYFEKVGHGQCQVLDTWWQTETGGIMISAIPDQVNSLPGSASKPFFGIRPALLDTEGNELEGEAEGALCLAQSWPGQARSLYGDHDRLVQTYYTTFPGYYFTGDGARRDKEGNYWITGRMDDVINVSGHRLGTAEVEDALDSHPAVIESAVVGFPHDIKGQGIYAYVTLSPEHAEDNSLKQELVQHVRKEIGPIATLDHIQWAPGLPKTRSGKIMRRILRKIAANEADQLGDTSTLAEPEVVENLVKRSLHHLTL